MEASIKRLNNLLAKKLISPQVYDDGIAAIESAMTQQSAGLPTPDQPAGVTIASKFQTFRAKNEERSGQLSYVIDFGSCALLSNQRLSPG